MIEVAIRTANGDIVQFAGPYRWLSNFWPAKVMLGGAQYPTVEHAYQASKTTHLPNRIRIRQAETPARAKQLGRRVTLRSDWDLIKLDVMEDLVRQKFTGDAKLRRRLLDTGTALIEERNGWGDSFWGVYKGEGKNHLGLIIMKVRAELLEEELRRGST